MMVIFPTRIPDRLSGSCFFRFLFSGTNICSTMTFPPLRISDHVVVVAVSFDFLPNSKWNALFHHIAYDCSFADRDSLCDHLRDVP